MFLVELLLPLYDNAGTAFGREAFLQVRHELTDRFGGVTAHFQAPAEGLWQADDGHVHRDRIVILEVMAKELDRGWWATYRAELEARFRQDAIVIRATTIDAL